MLRGADVPRVMTRVEAALHRQERTPVDDDTERVVFVDPDGHGDLGTAHLRGPADLEIEFHSGSARPVVGPVVRMAKRAVRRSLRWYIKPIMEQQSRFNHAMLDIVERLRMRDDQLLTVEIEHNRLDQARTEAAVDLLRADLLALATRTANAPVGAGAGAPGGPTSIADLPSVRTTLRYRAFEDRHRGPTDDVREMLRVYLPHFEPCRKVVDIGCGRGEFLSLLRDAGVPAYGVDSDEGMVEAVRDAGMEVVLDDAFSHLRGLQAGAVDGIFCSQVAEHLDTPQLLGLLELSLRKLAPGGVIVMETPNPEALSIFARFFYTDLTHVRPIHPDALRWAMEAVGFEAVRIERVLPVEDGVRLEHLPPELVAQDGWAAVAANIDRLNGVLFGPQNFAAVATTPRRP
ncbi:MAG TPA: class I SAM-dependent methyltransferase [Acidimicrobiales bacterium]|jgi:SAM-dependent methyltransferase|nr:class I SAM-dependent methyltransferase [Acidimicrobiales bacterium]